MASAAWLHGPNVTRLIEGLVSVLKEERPEHLPALLANYREHGGVGTQNTGAVGGLVGISNARLGSSKTRFEGLCLLSVLVKDSSSEVFQQHCLSWLRSLQQVIQSQAPLPTVQLAVSVLQDLLQYSCQLPELAREVGLNSILGILTSLLSLKSECHLAAMKGMMACMIYYPRACGSLKEKLGAYFLSKMDSDNPKVQEEACECYGRLPCLGGVLERGGGGHRAEGWTNQLHCLLASANSMLGQLYHGAEPEGTVQYEGPGVELPFPPLDDIDPLLILQLHHRFKAVCLALKHTLSVNPASSVRLPVQHVLNLVCRILAVNTKSISPTGDGCVKLLVLPSIHSDTFELLSALIKIVGGGLIQYSSVLTRLFSQSLSAWTPLPETSLGQQRAYSAVRVAVYRTVELWVRVGGASLLQGSPSHTELLFTHLIGDITPGADAVKLRSGQQSAMTDLVGSAGKPAPRRAKGLGMSDGILLQRKGDVLANQDTCVAALRALRQIILTSGTLLKEDLHKRLQDLVVPLCVRLQQQSHCASETGAVSGQYGSPTPRRELYRLLLALVLVPSPRWPPPLSCAVSTFSHGRRDRNIMMEYKVTVATGTSEYSGTNNYVYVTLVGERGESDRTVLDNPGLDLCRGAVDEYTVKSAADLGPLILVRLEKQKYWVEDNWFCRYVKVSVPGERLSRTFPCYRWLVGDGVVVELREGSAKKPSDDSLPQEIAHRKAELQERQKIYRWLAWAPGIPKCIDSKSEAELPQDARFDNEKRSDFVGSLQYALLELSLKKLAIKFGKSWNDLDDFKRIFWKLKSPIAEYTMKHWRDDWFFGYQFLNGSNPRMIVRLEKLPSNFPVCGDMVQSSLMPTTTLEKELKKGNIFLVDYAIMDGIPANVIRGKQQYIAAPLCLLYEHPEKGLIPIAIQLEQKPDKDTPIFLPSDPPLAWLLAKMWVRHSEFQVFQLLSHLLRTHLVVEVICVATLRQLPAVHPIYKLLAPHLRYTLEINCRGRTQLISSDGIFKRVVSTGGDGLLILAQREYKVLTYRSLQPKFDFLDRGVTKLRDYFYRDHSMMLWDVIQNFVSGIVSLYYKSDSEVEQDSELQAWIQDVVTEGFVDLPHFGLASVLKRKEELITLLSVTIFTCTAQHAATNNGQFDWCAWVPNTPCTMRQPPPTNKDTVTMGLIMDTLPDISQSCVQMAITWHLGRAQPDAIPMGQYVEQYFTEPAALKVIDKFRKDLKDLEEQIIAQNEGLELQYLYLCPSCIENSITI